MEKEKRRNIVVELHEDEALVFFEWLASFNEQLNESERPFSAEEIVLFSIEAKLEKMLSDIFLPDYKNILEDARKRVVSG